MNSVLINLISLALVSVMLTPLNVNVYANPIEVQSAKAMELNSPRAIEKTLEKSSETNPKAITQVNPEALTENANDDDEDLDTAANMVFRPLFVYRQQQAKRKRVVNKATRRKSESKPYVNYYPYGYPSYGYPYYRPIRRRPVQKKDKYEFPALF